MAREDINTQFIEDLAELKAAKQYYDAVIRELRDEIEEQNHLLSVLSSWKDKCETTEKIIFKIIFIVSGIATSIGVFLDNIKSYLKHLISWAA